MLSFWFFLSYLSFVFEILALGLAFYFKNTQFFFLSLALLCARSTYLFISFYQADLFISLFLPFTFIIFVFTCKSALIFERQNINKIIVLVFIGILAFFLSKNTNFNATLMQKIFTWQLLQPISDISLIFFIIEFTFLSYYCFRKKDFFILLAFFLSFIQFLFGISFETGFIEFASLTFVFYFFYRHYQFAFYEKNTNLPNERSFNRFILGRKDLTLVNLSIQNLDNFSDDEVKFLFKKIAKILKKQTNFKVFVINKNFVFVFQNLQNDICKAYIKNLKENLENTNFTTKERKLAINLGVEFKKLP